MVENLQEPEKNRRYTYADYLNWKNRSGSYTHSDPEEEKKSGFLGIYQAPEQYELINGEAFVIPEMPVENQAISTELFFALGDWLSDKPCRAFSGLDLRPFPKDDNSDDTVLRPDLLVVCDKSKLSPDAQKAWKKPMMHNGAGSALGSPDLVIEIVSSSASSRELQLKFDAYLKAGVPEYWVINPEKKSVQVHVYEKGSYSSVDYKGEVKLVSTILPGFSLELKNLWEAAEYTGLAD